LFCFVAFCYFLFCWFCFIFVFVFCLVFLMFLLFFTYFRFVVGCCKRSGCFGEFNYTDKSTWNTRDRRNWCRMIQMVDIREEGSSCPNASILFVFVLFVFCFCFCFCLFFKFVIFVICFLFVLVFMRFYILFCFFGDTFFVVFVLFLFVFFVNAFNSKYLCGINEAPSVLQALRGTGGLAVTYTRHLNTSQPRNKHVEGIRAITNSDKRL